MKLPLTALLLLTISLTGCDKIDDAFTKPKWEYAITNPPDVNNKTDTEMIGRLNAMGEQGWECAQTSWYGIFFCKRRK